MNKIPLTLMILLLLVVKIQAQSNVGIIAMGSNWIVK